MGMATLPPMPAGVNGPKMKNPPSKHPIIRPKAPATRYSAPSQLTARQGKREWVAMPKPSNPTQTLSLHFGADKHTIVTTDEGIEAFLPLPSLEGSPVETLPIYGNQTSTHRGFHILHSDHSTIAGVGHFAVDSPLALADVSEQSYNALFSAIGTEYQVYRIWNYVPDINLWADDMENYWRFNTGRRLAYESRYGQQDCEALMPAASAVGSKGEFLTVAFVAGTAPAYFIENPNQTPAYRYPPQFGPRPPSFSRGAWIEAHQTAYISGTASIRGHETIGSGDLVSQLQTTIENLHKVEQIMRDAGCQGQCLRLKAYLRNPNDCAEVKKALTSAYPGFHSLQLLQADICRSELEIEIEALITPTPMPVLPKSPAPV